jgi:hypothetical protein
MSIAGGNGVTRGGAASVNGGTGITGGNAILSAGVGSTTGGNTIINAGGSAGTPGNILFQGGGSTWATAFYDTIGGSTNLFFTFDTVVQPNIAIANGTNGTGQTFVIAGQNMTSVGATGGELAISAGGTTNTSGIGGELLLQGGNSSGGTSIGGNVVIDAGSGTTPGTIQLQVANNLLGTFVQTSLTQAAFNFASTYTASVALTQTGTLVNGALFNVQAQATTGNGTTGGEMIVGAGTAGGPNGIGGQLQLLGGGSFGGGTSIGGGVLIQAGSGATNGDILVNLPSGAEALRVDGTNNLLALSVPFIGDSTANDPLRFGVFAYVALSSINVVLTNTEYRNFTIRFNGTATGVFTITLPSQAGYTKVLDFSNCDMTNAGTINLQAAASPLVPLPGLGTNVGPIVIVSWDGTTIHVTHRLN